MGNQIKPVIIPVSSPRQTNSVSTSLIVVTLALLAAVVAYGVYPILGWRWSHQPFLGVLIEHTLVFSDLQSTVPGAWDVRQQVDEFGYQIRSLNNFPINQYTDLQEWIAQAEIGQEVELAWHHINPDIGSGTFQTTLSNFPTVDFVSFLVVPYAIGMAYLGMGIWVFWLRRQEPAGRVFPLFAASIAIVLGGLFDLSTTHRLTRLWTLSLGTAGGALLGLGLVFPQPIQLTKRYPGLHWVPIGVGAALGLISQFWIFDLTNPTAYVGWWKISYFYNGLGIVGFLVTMGLMIRRAESPIVRQQIRTILFGALLAFLPIGLWFLITAVSPSIRINIRWVIPTLVFFPLAITYSIMRYRWLKTDIILVRGITYATLAIVSSLIYAFILAFASLILGSRLPANNPIAVGLFVLILVAIFSPLRDRVQQWLNRVFSRSSGTYQGHLEEFTQHLTQAVELPSITSEFQGYLEQALGPEHVHIFIFEPGSGVYTAMLDQPSPISDLRFDEESDFIRYLQQTHGSVYLTPGEPLPDEIGADKAKVSVLDSLVICPIGKDHLEGFLALGERRSGEPYHLDEINFIEAMADQAFLGLARARVLSDLVRQVEHLEILNQLTQFLAAAGSRDALWIQLYEQTNRLMPAQNFCLALYDGDRRLSYACLWIDGQRMRDQEQHILPDDYGLITVVARDEQPLRVGSYQWECSARDIVLDHPYRAWMGAPLMFNSQSLGAISVASSTADITYTQDQLELLKAVADQVAGILGTFSSARDREADQQSGQSEAQASTTTELNLLHNFDLELNQRLDIYRAAEGALRSVVDYTRAVAGFIAIFEDGKLIPKASLGYPPDAGPTIDQVLPQQSSDLNSAMEKGQSIRSDVPSASEPVIGLDPNARSLLIMPLRLENHLIGSIVLEASQPGAFTDDHIDFITRFSHHATIAITCSKLYIQFQAAKVEKAGSIASISQSIKTPLLSIKENADRLLAGSQGDANDDLRSSLETIRADVDQIAKLLLELARSGTSKPGE